MSWRKILVFVFYLVALIGCVGIESENGRVRFLNSKDEVSSPIAVKHRDIIEYGSLLASLDDKARLKECRSIAEQNQADANSKTRLQYALALMITPECGELREALEILSSASPRAKSLSRQLEFQTAVVGRILEEVDQKQKLEDEVGQLTRSEAVLRNRQLTNESQLEKAKTDLKTLQSKLDAIKSIEKSINQRNGNPIQ